MAKMTVSLPRLEDSPKCYVYGNSFEGGLFPILIKVWVPRSAQKEPKKLLEVEVDL